MRSFEVSKKTDDPSIEWRERVVTDVVMVASARGAVLPGQWTSDTERMTYARQIVLFHELAHADTVVMHGRPFQPSALMGVGERATLAVNQLLTMSGNRKIARDREQEHHLEYDAWRGCAVQL